MLTHIHQLFRKTIIRPVGVAPAKFTHALENDEACQRTPQHGWGSPNNFYRASVSIAACYTDHNRCPVLAVAKLRSCVCVCVCLFVCHTLTL